MPEDVSYPAQKRYTLQWLETPDEFISHIIPNNIDAAFKKCTQARPSELLLHYNYGAAAVKQWGRGTELLHKLASPPRPSVPAPAQMGPSRTEHDRSRTIRQLNDTRGATQAGAGNSTAGAGMVDSNDQAQWDEDEVMMFFWGNSEAANERHRMKAEDNTLRMEQWRRGVP